MRGVLTRASAALDRGVARFLERKLKQTRQIDPADARKNLLDVAAVYNRGTLGLPSPFFPTPHAIAPSLTPQGDGPLGTQVVDLDWRSEYEAFHPTARAMATPENGRAHARWFTSGKGRPTLVAIHGWGGGNLFFESKALGAAYWLKHGYDVALFVLPHHGARTAGPSGASFPSTNPLRTNEAFGQAIFDLRALAAWLRNRGSSAVGAIGMSLGGYTTGLWASIDDELAFAVALIPAVSMAQLMWRHGEHSAQRKRAIDAGITEDLLVDAFAVHEPRTRKVLLPPERLAVIAGKGDRITGPEQAEDLAKHWGVDVGWFDGGHLAQIGRGDAIRDVRRKLSSLNLPGRVFRG